MRNHYENWMQQLADDYLKKSSSIQEPGLFNGKTGAAIILFKYAQISGIEKYAERANHLIGDVFEIVLNRLPINFENGLTGIGWGILYLRQNGFLTAGADYLLDEIDKLLFVSIIKSRTLISNSGTYGAGIYFTERLKPLNGSSTNLFKRQKVQLSSYLRDDIERLLSQNAQFVFNTPELGLEQLNSIIYFYLEMMKLNLIEVNVERLLDFLIRFTKHLPSDRIDILNIHTSKILLKRILKNLADDAEIDKTIWLLKKFRHLIHEDKVISKLKSNEIAKISWQSIAYNIYPCQIKT